MLKKIKIVAKLIFVLLVISGCSMIDRRNIFRSTPKSTFDSNEVLKYAENQNEVYRNILTLAGLKTEPSNAGQWRAFINAGMSYADDKCEAYMDSLFWLDREKNAMINQISLVGTATVGILAATEAAAKEVAITAIAFGLASASIDNISKSFLYDLEPSGIRNLVEGLQGLYKEKISNDVNDRTIAFEVIRGYAAICLPTNIEAEVNNSIKQANATAIDGTSNSAPRVSISPQVINIQAPASKIQAMENDRLNSINEKIKSMDDSKAISLINNPPVTITADIQNSINAMDPTDKRTSNGDAARSVLLFMVTQTAKNEAAISSWESALK